MKGSVSTIDITPQDDHDLSNVLNRVSAGAWSPMNGFERKVLMSIRIICRGEPLNWRQAIEVKGLVVPCTGNHQASYMDGNQ